MFCPQCRQSWPARSSQASDPSPKTPWKLRSPFKKTRAGLRHCPVCHGPLVNDRLEQEFPPVAHASPKSEPSLSMSEILREIGHGGTPSGAGELDETRAWLRAAHSDETPHPSQQSGQRRFGKRQISLDTLLGFGALAAIVMVVVSLAFGVVWNDMRTPVPHPTAVATPLRTLVPHPELQPEIRSVMSWPPASILALLPATVPGGWHRWESDASLTQTDTFAAAGQRVAAYQRGTEIVHVWLLKAPESDDALTAFGGAARFIHQGQSVTRQTPRAVHLFGHDCLAFEDTLPLAVPHFIEASHPFAVDGFTLTWYSAGTLVTFASADKNARDAFVSAYAPQH